MLNKLRLLTFDVTNTLMRVHGSVGEHYVAAANRYFGATGMLFDSKTIDRHFKSSFGKINKDFPNFGYANNITSEEWWYRVVEGVFISAGLKNKKVIRSISNQLYSDFSTERNWVLFPDVKETLEKLREMKMSMGIISNFDERLELILERLDIRRYFHIFLCSRITGIAKPATEVFEAALALANVEPYEALHIGDNETLDCIPAARAGMKTVIIKRDLNPFGNLSSSLTENCSTVQINSLSEIFKMVQV